MRQVWKFPVPVDRGLVKMPKGARLLTVQIQFAAVVVWALVDPEAEMVYRKLMTVGTGHPMGGDVDDFAYVGTFQLHGGALVFHLFDAGEEAIG